MTSDNWKRVPQAMQIIHARTRLYRAHVMGGIASTSSALEQYLVKF
ncbi:hypothetical protein [Paenibacillus hemerocallicola]|nr:hypothetical protein [Paenibacillus hemerocallicola]